MRRRLRIAPTCYHVLHQVPARIAHEMSFFTEEGLLDANGDRTYELLTDGICPFGLERQGMWRSSLERDVGVLLDVKPQSVIYSRREYDADLFVVAGWRNQQTGIWMARPEIESAADLRGKTVGIIDFGGISHSGFKARLRSLGIEHPEEEVNWVRGVSAPHNLEYLRSGRVDCTLFHGYEQEALLAEGFTLISRMRDTTPQGKADRVLAVSGKLINSNPEMLIGLLRGMLRSYWFIRNPANFRYLVGMERRMRLDSPSGSERRRLSFSSVESAVGLPFPLDGVATGFDAAFADAVSNGELDYVPADAEIEKMCRFEFVDKANAELRARPDIVAQDLTFAEQVAKGLGY